MKSFTPKFRGLDYLEQWDRVERWYKKVKEVESNQYQISGVNISEQEDYIYIFFLQIFNLKDWIKNHTGDSNIEKKFDYKNGDLSLKICADFVTNFKHFENTKKVRIHKDTYFISRDAQVGARGPIHTWWIGYGEERVDAYRLADDCYEIMKSYMEQKKYI